MSRLTLGNLTKIEFQQEVAIAIAKELPKITNYADSGLSIEEG